MKPTLDEHELDFLHATSDLSRRQAELYPMLADAIDADPYDFAMLESSPRDGGWYERWQHRRRHTRLARGRTGDWSWCFHGLECDMWNIVDGRFVRIDFGPTTQRLVVTGWGVLQYVMCVAPPWQCFDRLRAHLAGRGPPYDSLAGDHAKMSRICNRLEELELLMPADRDLVALRERLSVRDANGARLIDVPDELAPPGWMDLAVCGRLIVAESARAVLR